MGKGTGSIAVRPSTSGSGRGIPVSLSNTIVTSTELIEFTGISSYSLISSLHEYVETYVKNYCNKNFVLCYYNELYDGDGTNILYLRQLPIESIIRVSIGNEYAIKISNTSLDALSAYINVTDESIILSVDGGNNESKKTVSKSSSVTINELLHSINSYGYGWEASIVNSNFANYPITSIYEQYVDCTRFNYNTSKYSYIYITGEPVNVLLYKDRGAIYYSSAFPRGNKNVIVKYIAGYSQTDMPGDIKLAVCMLVKFLHQRNFNDAIGIERFSLGHLSIAYKDNLPPEVNAILDIYKVPTI